MPLIVLLRKPPLSSLTELVFHTVPTIYVSTSRAKQSFAGCLVLIILLSLLFVPASAKLTNSFAANKLQYGEPSSMESFPSKLGYTGYATYDIDKDWKLKAFFLKDKVKSEHLVPKTEGNAKLSRNEVREWAMKMYAPALRGPYRRKITQYKVEGHFFDRGLIAYEYFIVNKATQGYQGVKVLFYEKDRSYASINPKAYL